MSSTLVWFVTLCLPSFLFHHFHFWSALILINSSPLTSPHQVLPSLESSQSPQVYTCLPSYNIILYYIIYKFLKSIWLWKYFIFYYSKFGYLFSSILITISLTYMLYSFLFLFIVIHVPTHISETEIYSQWICSFNLAQKYCKEIFLEHLKGGENTVIVISKN